MKIHYQTQHQNTWVYGQIYQITREGPYLGKCGVCIGGITEGERTKPVDLCRFLVLLLEDPTADCAQPLVVRGPDLGFLPEQEDCVGVPSGCGLNYLSTPHTNLLPIIELPDCGMAAVFLPPGQRVTRENLHNSLKS